MKLVGKAAWADSIYLLLFWSLMALNPTQPAHEKKQQ